MNDDLEQLLTQLRLTKIAQILEEQVVHAESEGLPFRKLLAQLLRAECHHRQESALTWRIKKAGMPEHWTLESFPFKKQPGVNQRQIRTFAELGFISKAENIVFVGPTGVGKSGIACGILLKALHNGYRGVFVKAQDLFDEMYASLADRSTRKLLRYLSRIDILVIDSCGVPGYVKSELRDRAGMGSEVPGLHITRSAQRQRRSSHSRIEASSRQPDSLASISAIGFALASAARLVSRSTAA